MKGTVKSYSFTLGEVGLTGKAELILSGMQQHIYSVLLSNISVSRPAVFEGTILKLPNNPTTIELKCDTEYKRTDTLKFTFSGGILGAGLIAVIIQYVDQNAEPKSLH